MEDSWLMAVDGTGLLVRCSRAAARTGMTALDGTPTGALTLFAGSLAAMVRESRPQYLLVAWDGPGARTWRRDICPGYKQNRPEFPDKMPAEGSQAREFCEAAGIAQWALDGFEGDDLLAAAARLASRDLPGTQTVLASDDNDILQLAAGGRVWVRALGRNGTLTDAETVELLYGVPPEYLPMLRALAGDRSDGIPGVPGAGPVTAARLLTLAGFQWAEVLKSLPEGQPRADASAWNKVMDLNNPPKRPEDHDETGILDIRRTEWTRGNILPVLEKYGMRSMAERWRQGHFW